MPITGETYRAPVVYETVSAPTTPLVDIIDPLGVTRVTDAAVTMTGGISGAWIGYYDYLIPADGPEGIWTARFTGDGDDAGNEYFTVTADLSGGDSDSEVGLFNEWYFVDSDKRVVALPGATVHFYKPGTTDYATRYNSSGVSLTAGPFVLDAGGNFDLYAEPGAYDAKINNVAHRIHIPDSPAGKISMSALDTDETLAGNSDTKIPSQKATRTFVMERVRSLRAFATAGSGSSGDPWTGWESALATAKSIYAEQGNFRQTAPIDVTVPVELQGVAGDLLKGTVFQNPNGTDFFVAKAGSPGMAIRRVCFQKVGAAPGAGSGVKLDSTLASLNGTGTAPITLEDIGLYNLYDGIIANGGNKVVLNRILSGGIVNDGIQASNVIDLYLDKVSIMGAGRDCYRFDSVGGINLSQVTAYAATQRGVRLLGTARHLFAQSLVVDVCTGHGIEIAGNAYQMFFANCWSAASTNGHGLYLNQSVASIDGGGSLIWTGGTIRYNGLSGVRIGGLGEGYHFIGAGFGSNGVLAVPADRNGVLVEAGRKYFSVESCFLGSLVGDAVDVQENGVRVLAGASDFYQIRGNVYRGHAGANVIDGGAGLNKWVEHSEAGPEWITPSLAAPWVVPAGSQGPRYRKLGRQVFVEGLLQNSSGSPTSVPPFTLPAGYRPLSTVWITGFGGNSIGVTGAGAVTPAAPVPASGFLGTQISFGAEV